MEKKYTEQDMDNAYDKGVKDATTKLQAENDRLKEGIKELINSFKSSGVGWMEINELESILNPKQ
jgi:hypothetical protein